MVWMCGIGLHGHQLGNVTKILKHAARWTGSKPKRTWLEVPGKDRSGKFKYMDDQEMDSCSRSFE